MGGLYQKGGRKMNFDYWNKRLKAIVTELDEFFTEADESGVYNAAEMNKIAAAIETLDNEASGIENKQSIWVRRNPGEYQETPNGGDYSSHL